MKNQVKRFSQYIKESDEIAHRRGNTSAEYEPLGSHSALGRINYRGNSIMVPYPEDILGDNLGEYEGYMEDNSDAYHKWVCRIAMPYGIQVIHDSEGGTSINCSDYKIEQ